jgi:uncharacterized membrane protein YbhN (UPF0104 family)
VTAGPDDEPLPFGEDLDELEHLAEEQGLHALDVPEKLVHDELHRKSGRRRVFEIGGSIAIIVVMFAIIIPRLTKADYRASWHLIKQLDWTEVLALFAMWFVNLFTVFTFLTHAFPGLRRPQGGVLNLSGSMLANVVPFGGAAGVGATYAQCLSWGFDPSAVTLGVLVSGMWNVFAKLVPPVIALLLLAAIGQSAPVLDVAAYVGLGMAVGAVILMVLIFRSDRAAMRIGVVTEKVINGLRAVVRRPPTHGVVGKVLDFRDRSAILVRRQWRSLTGWLIAYKFSSFLLELLCIRVVGIGSDVIGPVEVLAAYTLGELLSANPVTPSGVGFVEAGNATVLIFFGAPHDAAVAAVILFRIFDYLLEIPAGALAWVVWATKRSWRRPPGTIPSISSSVEAR